MHCGIIPSYQQGSQEMGCSSLAKLPQIRPSRGAAAAGFASSVDDAEAGNTDDFEEPGGVDVLAL